MGFSVVYSLLVSFQNRDLGGIQMRSLCEQPLSLSCKLFDKCKCEKYSHFSMNRMASRAAGHRYKVRWTGHVGEANPRGRHLGSDHVENCDKLKKKRRLSVFCKKKEYKEKYKYNYAVLEPVIMQ